MRDTIKILLAIYLF